ncbi:MAG: hypothetical protein COB15_03050 [Flavobacteriales bacterium]|nr:MAG: hypothetical protein COB15_03050 [Flavobacteriales bacterium]
MNKYRAMKVSDGKYLFGQIYKDEKGNTWLTDSANINLNTHKNIAWFWVVEDTVGRLAAVNSKGVEFYEGMNVGRDYDDGDGLHSLGLIEWSNEVLGWVIDKDNNLSDYIDEIEVMDNYT